MPDLVGLVRTHQAGLWRYLRFLGCDADTAEDLVQDTFLCVHRQPFADRGGDATAGYLRVVARNLFLKERRASRRRPLPAELGELDRVWDELSARDTDAHRAALRHCLAGLPERSRRILDLRYRDRASRRQMACLLELTEEGVKTSIRRVKHALKDCIERRLGR